MHLPAASSEGEPLERFLAIASQPEARVDLAEAALWVAARARPSLDVAAYCERIDALAHLADQRLGRAVSLPERVDRLNGFLFLELGFRGNREQYLDPRNSYLDHVLERRLGIPISLSIVWIAVARRLGMDARGIGFPGHFLATAGGAQPVLVDPFGGRTLEESDCRALLREVAGESAAFDPRLLAPSPAPEVLARVVRNLKQIHVQRRELDKALCWSNWILELEPNAPLELRDRGLLHRALECWTAAREDLERYLSLVPRGSDALKIHALLEDLRRRAGRLH